MQRAMDTLDGFLKRHKRAVLAAWLVAIVAAVPFASRQTEHLSSGGFGVPGSGSKTGDDELGRFPGVSRDQLAVGLRGHDPPGVRPAVARVQRAVAGEAPGAIPPGGGRPAAPGLARLGILPPNATR